MNNNRGNNRRRGRGNRQQGGGQQVNRIDSRARGNAPQLLEKYRKLAHDAHLNGDRVQAEYYLQFADHYFRVIADTRQRQEEQRQRRDERWEPGMDDATEDSGEFSVESDFPSFEQPGFARRERSERPERADRQDGRRRRDERDEEQSSEEDASIEEQGGVEQDSGEEGAQANPYEPAENPFVRDNRAKRGLKPRREGRRSRDDDEGEGGAEAEVGLDPASLPPSISASRDEDGEEQPRPRRGRPRRKPSADDAGEALESVN